MSRSVKLFNVKKTVQCILALQIICVPFHAKASSVNQHQKISFDSDPASIFLDQDNKLI